MTRRFKALFTASTLAALGATTMLIAQTAGAPQLPGRDDPTRVTGGTYAIEGGHTQVLFSYDHFGFTKNMGMLSGGTGTLVLDPKALDKASVTVDVPINTLHTTIAKLDQEFQTEKWFNAAQFPTARFVSTAVHVEDKDSAKIHGNLTIRGVTKPVILDAEFEAAGVNPMNKKETVAFEASTKIKRSDFGINQYVPMVGDEVELKIVLAAEKQ